MERTNWWWVANSILTLGLTIFSIIIDDTHLGALCIIIFFLTLHKIHEEVKEVKQ